MKCSDCDAQALDACMVLTKDGYMLPIWLCPEHLTAYKVAAKLTGGVTYDIYRGGVLQPNG